ncbi:putative uncharacterized protein DDB_G0282133 isoform X2 [Panonychus citri]|uniref:putative uncharacterized protein DDB_G0282133 isoform X2 n=1 Tax=Panonychus citri TaxID=50023 RepID=UPI002308171B|nr:putative uncharacterized protein DDB_G0282133 isoform X2 [Panonychus citri]
MLNKRNASCSLIPSDQQSQCKESGVTIASDTISSSSTTTIPSTYLLPPLLASSSSLEPTTTSSTTTTTISSRPNGSQLTEIGRNFPEKVSMVTQVSTSTLSPSSTTDDDKIQQETTTCFNNSNNDNMTGNIEKIINCKSEQISVNLLSSKTFNKFTPNVFNLRPTISTHPTRKHHHHHSHLSPSLSQHRRSELRRFNQNKGNDDSEGEGTTNCYTSSSEHSMDTVIFCGKSMRSSCNANNQQHHHQVHHSIPSSPKSSPSPGKPKVPTTTNGLPKTPMCQPMMMVIAKSSNCSNMTQQQSPKRYSSSSSNTTSSSPLINQLSIDPTINHSSDKKINVKKLVCDIGTSPLHKNSLNCKTKCNRNDELWVDKPKKSKRKKPPHRISGVELWVDGPNAIPINSNITSESTNCEFTEKHQRTTEWINQHAKTILIASNKGNSCCGQHWTSSNNCGKSINENTNITNPVTTSKSSKSNSSNGANGTIIDLSNPASPYHVGVSELTIKEKHLIDKLIETKEMACQTESNEKLIVSESMNCTNNSNTNEKLNTEETLILLSNLHDNHEGDYEDDAVDDNDWTDERRLMLLERGALSDCCDNRICCCCSSSFTSEDDENVAVDDHVQGDDKMIDKDKQTIELKSIKDDIGSTKENNLDSNTELIPNKLSTSNQLTEPPGQLKLEQFLKQLITVTNPSLNDNENMEKIKKDKDKNHHHRHRSHHGHHGYHHHQHHHHAGERKLSQPINHYNDYPQYDSLPPRRLTRSKFNGTKYYDSFGSHQDLTNCSVDDNQINRLKSTLDDANCKSVGYIITKDLPINDDCSKNHVTLLPTSPRINRILGVQTKVECINITNSPTKSSRKQSCNKRDTTSTTTSGHGTTSEGDDRSVVTKKSSDSSSSPSQSHDRTFNSSSSSASQYHHHHHYHRSGQNSSGGPSSSGYDSTIKDEESDRELVIIDNDDQSNEINGKKLMITDEDNTCNVVTLTANNNESANNSNDISNNGNNNNSNHTNLQGSCNIVKSSVKMRDKSEKQNRKNKKDKEKDKRESLTSEKCSFLCCKLTSFY